MVKLESVRVGVDNPQSHAGQKHVVEATICFQDLSIHPSTSNLFSGRNLAGIQSCTLPRKTNMWP
jgi:hypothetical protein